MKQDVFIANKGRAVVSEIVKFCKTSGLKKKKKKATLTFWKCGPPLQLKI